MKPRYVRKYFCRFYPQEYPYYIIEQDTQDGTPPHVGSNAWFRQPEIAVRMITIDRPEPYIHRTLESLYASDYQGEVTVLPGSQAVDYLGRYKDHPKVRVEPLADWEWESIRDEPKRIKVNYNWSRGVLRRGRGYVFLEDDILFHPEWFGKLRKLLYDIEVRDGYTSYVLALYSMYPVQTRKSYGAMFRRVFRNAQCLYVPETVVSRLVKYVKTMTFRNRRSQSTSFYDLYIRGFCVCNDVPIFASANSLAQHFGTTSSCDMDWHCAKNFFG